MRYDKYDQAGSPENRKEVLIGQDILGPFSVPFVSAMLLWWLWRSLDLVGQREKQQERLDLMLGTQDEEALDQGILRALSILSNWSRQAEESANNFDCR